MTGSPAAGRSSIFLTPGLEAVLRRHLLPAGGPGGSPGFRPVLDPACTRRWASHRGALEATAEQVAGALRTSLAESRSRAAEPPPAAAADRASGPPREPATSPSTGGFGGPPQVPQPGNLFFLCGARPGRETSRRAPMVARDPRPDGPRRHPRPARRRLPPLHASTPDGRSPTSRRCSTTTPSSPRSYPRGPRRRGRAPTRSAPRPRHPRLPRSPRWRSPEGGFKSAIDAETDGDGGRLLRLDDATSSGGVLGDVDFRFLAPAPGLRRPAQSSRASGYVLHLPHPLAEQAARLGPVARSLPFAGSRRSSPSSAPPAPGASGHGSTTRS